MQKVPVASRFWQMLASPMGRRVPPRVSQSWGES